MKNNGKSMINHSYLIAVVIPCFRCKKQILGVIAAIGPEVGKIYVVDDSCPEKTGDFVEQNCTDKKVTIIRHAVNQGVGGAVITGYKAALEDGFEIAVKIDGDGQMDPVLIPEFIQPITSSDADYTKGNRFFYLEEINKMPKVRLFGNALLSIITKISSGYWNIFDPTNGYTAIHLDVLKRLPLEKLSKRFFFESDMLFRLNTIRARVIDIPMDAKYGNEVSNLKIQRIAGEFMRKNAKNFIKRIFYNYYLRDMSLASIQLPLGIIFLFFGAVHGLLYWNINLIHGEVTPAGTVMLSALPIILGMQLVLSFLSYDIESVPTRSIHKRYIKK